jgi:hypothetical protein
MNSDAFQLQIFLSLLSTSVPTILVCIVAGVVIVARRSDAPAAAPYALFAFGLLFVLCFVMPLGQTMLQHWVFEEGQRGSRMWAFTAFAFVNSALHAIIYACLLLAIFAGRPKAGPG